MSLHTHACIQVDAALERGIECECFNSAVPEAKRGRIAAELASGTQTISLLYTTPESIALPALRDALKEAHEGGCILRFVRLRASLSLQSVGCWTGLPQ